MSWIANRLAKLLPFGRGKVRPLVSALLPSVYGRERPGAGLMRVIQKLIGRDLEGNKYFEMVNPAGE